MGILDFFTRRKNRDPLYKSEKIPDEGPRNCPVCGSRIEAFAEVVITEDSPAAIEDGFVIGGVIPERARKVDYEDAYVDVPAKVILVRLDGPAPCGPEYVCLGLKNRADVMRYMAPDFPNGRVPISVESMPPCGWRGISSDYGIKWI